MSQDEFTRLFNYMERRFSAIERRLDNCVTKDEFNLFVNLVDSHIKRMDIFQQEFAGLNHQVNRHEDWIGKASKTTGVQYSP